MDWLTVLFIIGTVLFVGGSIFLIFFRKEKNVLPEIKTTPQSNQLQLQAYERITLLVDRIALPNLISRLNQSGVPAVEMQLLLTQSIRQEFDYNITQQIYISGEAWNAVKGLKDQNLLIINQIASSLPADATGFDLNKKILDFLITDNRSHLHEAVSQLLSFEAKKLL
jgi:hypothetical protein